MDNLLIYCKWYLTAKTMQYIFFVFFFIWTGPGFVKSHFRLDPDTGLNISQFLSKYGYPLEYHEVTTDDGYILTMHRIPYGKNETIEKIMVKKTRPATLLVHCLACSSMDYVWQGPNTSLAFLLADLGYDVWLANTRGNVHSMRHISLTSHDKAFWGYSFHEKGYLDMPACIDHILNVTKLENITYIGHSEGTIEGLILTSTRPEYNKKINLMMLLSPAAYLNYVRSPIVQFLNKYSGLIKFLLDLFHIYGIPYGPVIPFLTKVLCNEHNPFQTVCINIIELFVGFDVPEIDKVKLTVFLTNTPNGVSVKEVVHCIQMSKSGDFRQYDYGRSENLLHYGSAEPPSYDVSKITLPIAAYYGQNDYLVGVPAVKKLLSELPNQPVVDEMVDYKSFNHLDFLTAKDVKILLYDKLIKDLQKYGSGL